MSTFPKIFLLLTLALFGTITALFIFKKDEWKGDVQTAVLPPQTIAIDLSTDAPEISAPSHSPSKAEEPPAPVQNLITVARPSHADLPDTDRIQEFFNKNGPKFPIVETIAYKSRVPWHPGKSAWIADYAAHYKTSRHFIARSLNGKPDYEKQEVKEGDKFNILRPDKEIEFYLLADLSSNRMGFYYMDRSSNEKVLVKTYSIGTGRPDPSRSSGYLTPSGVYSLGSKVAVYRPNMKGLYQGERVEMVRIFGTRWIPFGQEIAEASDSSKGLGIHGLPLAPNERGEYRENLDSLGKYESDGCIRMATQDMEELFSIVISRPTTLEIVARDPREN